MSPKTLENMEIRIYVNGTMVDLDTREDHMDHIDVSLNRESLAEAMEEIPDCDDVFTFGNTGCKRRMG